MLTLTGMLEVKVSPGTAPGAKVLLRGRGIEGPDGFR